MVRYSKTPGNFAVQWTSAGRQIKNAKIFAKTGGYSWRHDGKVHEEEEEVVVVEEETSLIKCVSSVDQVCL